MSTVMIKSRVDITREGYSPELIAEMEPLLRSHWLEIANYQDEIPYDPDFEQYRSLDKKGRLLALTARIGGVLVGYSVFFLTTHAHYKSTLFALNDVFYVAPRHRKGSIPLRLIRESERAAKALGVTKLSWHVKPSNQMADILIRLAYALDEYTLGRVL